MGDQEGNEGYHVVSWAATAAPRAHAREAKGADAPARRLRATFWAVTAAPRAHARGAKGADAPARRLRAP